MKSLSPVKRVEGLDVARGLAATFVVVHHTLRCVPGLDAASYTPKMVLLTHQWRFRLLFLGPGAVTLFFVLSGASLAISLGDRRLRLRSFFTRRFFRIYPLYVLSIVLYYFYRPIYWHISTDRANRLWLSQQFTTPATGWIWFIYLTMLSDWFNLTSGWGFNNALWSLPIEMQFYLAFPLIIWLLRSRPKSQGIAWVILLCLSTMFASHLLHRSSMGPLLRLWEFAGGAILGINYQAILGSTRLRKARPLLLIATAACFLCSLQGYHLRLTPDNTFEVFAAFGLVLILLSNGDWQAERPVSKLLVKIGAWSYGLYLFHGLVLSVYAPFFSRFGPPPIAHGSLLYAVALFLLVYPTSVLLSALLYERFERPFIRFGAARAAGAPKEPSGHAA